jgi:hypothetical protein
MEAFMKLHRITLFLITALLLAACASATTSPVVTENPTVPPTQSSSPTQITVPTLSSASPSYPAPGSEAAVPTTSAYPAPGQSGTDSSAIPLSGYEPQPGDDSLKRDEVTVDLGTSQLLVTATEPAQAKAVINGTMPDPCHSLRVEVTPADSTNTININAYSLYDPNTACVTKVDPFSATIPLGSYSSGDYTVNVNGEKLGMFQTVFAPQPEDDKLDRGDATVDMKTSRIVKSSTEAGAVNVDLKGYMPDPCHQLRIVMTPADSERNIKLEVYSVFNSKNACITVIQPFEVIFPLGSFTTGHYSVYVNGDLLGEFDI